MHVAAPKQGGSSGAELVSLLATSATARPVLPIVTVEFRACRAWRHPL
jgi:hypothetical protein